VGEGQEATTPDRMISAVVMQIFEKDPSRQQAKVNRAYAEVTSKQEHLKL
jgi:transposase